MTEDAKTCRTCSHHAWAPGFRHSCKLKGRLVTADELDGCCEDYNNYLEKEGGLSGKHSL